MGATMVEELRKSKRKEEGTLSAEKVKYGDWLSYQGRNVQVIANNHYTAIVKDSQGVITCTHYEDLEPITLTQSIFENNGWDYWDEEYVKEYELFKMVIDECFPLTFSVGVKEHLDWVHICNIYYVHELQHILSALKINDNIRL